MGAVTPHYKPLVIIGAVATAAADEKAHTTQEGQTSLTTTSGWNGSGADGGANHYVELPGVHDMEALSIFIRWYDATSSATITLEGTNLPADLASAYAETPAWAEISAVTITGPSATAADSSLTNVSAIGHRRLRLKIVVAADTEISIWSWGKE